MKIKLHNDFRGVITDERYYLAGEYEGGVNMPLPHAQALVADGRAVLVEVPKPKPVAPKPKPAGRSRKVRR